MVTARPIQAHALPPQSAGETIGEVRVCALRMAWLSGNTAKLQPTQARVQVLWCGAAQESPVVLTCPLNILHLERSNSAASPSQPKREFVPLEPHLGSALFPLHGNLNDIQAYMQEIRQLDFKIVDLETRFAVATAVFDLETLSRSIDQAAHSTRSHELETGASIQLYSTSSPNEHVGNLDVSLSVKLLPNAAATAMLDSRLLKQPVQNHPDDSISPETAMQMLTDLQTNMPANEQDREVAADDEEEEPGRRTSRHGDNTTRDKHARVHYSVKEHATKVERNVIYSNNDVADKREQQAKQASLHQRSKCVEKHVARLARGAAVRQQRERNRNKATTATARQSSETIDDIEDSDSSEDDVPPPPPPHLPRQSEAPPIRPPAANFSEFIARAQKLGADMDRAVNDSHADENMFGLPNLDGESSVRRNDQVEGAGTTSNIDCMSLLLDVSEHDTATRDSNINEYDPFAVDTTNINDEDDLGWVERLVESAVELEPAFRNPIQGADNTVFRALAPLTAAAAVGLGRATRAKFEVGSLVVPLVSSASRPSGGGGALSRRSVNSAACATEWKVECLLKLPSNAGNSRITSVSDTSVHVEPSRSLPSVVSGSGTGSGTVARALGRHSHARDVLSLPIESSVTIPLKFDLDTIRQWLDGTVVLKVFNNGFDLWKKRRSGTGSQNHPDTHAREGGGGGEALELWGLVELPLRDVIVSHALKLSGSFPVLDSRAATQDSNDKLSAARTVGFLECQLEVQFDENNNESNINSYDKRAVGNDVLDAMETARRHAQAVLPLGQSKFRGNRNSIKPSESSSNQRQHGEPDSADTTVAEEDTGNRTCSDADEFPALPICAQLTLKFGDVCLDANVPEMNVCFAVSDVMAPSPGRAGGGTSASFQGTHQRRSYEIRSKAEEVPTFHKGERRRWRYIHTLDENLSVNVLLLPPPARQPQAMLVLEIWAHNNEDKEKHSSAMRGSLIGLAKASLLFLQDLVDARGLVIDTPKEFFAPPLPVVDPITGKHKGQLRLRVTLHTCSVVATSRSTPSTTDGTKYEAEADENYSADAAIANGTSNVKQRSKQASLHELPVGFVDVAREKQSGVDRTIPRLRSQSEHDRDSGVQLVQQSSGHDGHQDGDGDEVVDIYAGAIVDVDQRTQNKRMHDGEGASQIEIQRESERDNREGTIPREALESVVLVVELKGTSEKFAQDDEDEGCTVMYDIVQDNTMRHDTVALVWDRSKQANNTKGRHLINMQPASQGTGKDPVEHMLGLNAGGLDLRLFHGINADTGHGSIGGGRYSATNDSSSSLLPSNAIGHAVIPASEFLALARTSIQEKRQLEQQYFEQHKHASDDILGVEKSWPISPHRCEVLLVLQVHPVVSSSTSLIEDDSDGNYVDRVLGEMRVAVRLVSFPAEVISSQTTSQIVIHDQDTSSKAIDTALSLRTNAETKYSLHIELARVGSLEHACGYWAERNTAMRLPCAIGANVWVSLELHNAAGEQVPVPASWKSSHVVPKTFDAVVNMDVRVNDLTMHEIEGSVLSVKVWHRRRLGDTGGTAMDRPDVLLAVAEIPCRDLLLSHSDLIDVDVGNGSIGGDSDYNNVHIYPLRVTADGMLGDFVQVSARVEKVSLPSQQETTKATTDVEVQPVALFSRAKSSQQERDTDVWTGVDGDDFTETPSRVSDNDDLHRRVSAVQPVVTRGEIVTRPQLPSNNTAHVTEVNDSGSIELTSERVDVCVEGGLCLPMVEVQTRYSSGITTENNTSLEPPWAVVTYQCPDSIVVISGHATNEPSCAPHWGNKNVHTIQLSSGLCLDNSGVDENHLWMKLTVWHAREDSVLSNRAVGHLKYVIDDALGDFESGRQQVLGTVRVDLLGKAGRDSGGWHFVMDRENRRAGRIKVRVSRHVEVLATETCVGEEEKVVSTSAGKGYIGGTYGYEESNTNDVPTLSLPLDVRVEGKMKEEEVRIDSPVRELPEVDSGWASSTRATGFNLQNEEVAAARLHEDSGSEEEETSNRDVDESYVFGVVHTDRLLSRRGRRRRSIEDALAVLDVVNKGLGSRLDALNARDNYAMTGGTEKKVVDVEQSVVGQISESQLATEDVNVNVDDGEVSVVQDSVSDRIAENHDKERMSNVNGEIDNVVGGVLVEPDGAEDIELADVNGQKRDRRVSVQKLWAAVESESAAEPGSESATEAVTNSGETPGETPGEDQAAKQLADVDVGEGEKQNENIPISGDALSIDVVVTDVDQYGHHQEEQVGEEEKQAMVVSEDTSQQIEQHTETNLSNNVAVGDEKRNAEAVVTDEQVQQIHSTVLGDVATEQHVEHRTPALHQEEEEEEETHALNVANIFEQPQHTPQPTSPSISAVATVVHYSDASMQTETTLTPRARRAAASPPTTSTITSDVCLEIDHQHQQNMVKEPLCSGRDSIGGGDGSNSGGRPNGSICGGNTRARTGHVVELSIDMVCEDRPSTTPASLPSGHPPCPNGSGVTTPHRFHSLTSDAYSASLSATTEDVRDGDHNTFTCSATMSAPCTAVEHRVPILPTGPLPPRNVYDIMCKCCHNENTVSSLSPTISRPAVDRNLHEHPDTNMHSAMPISPLGNKYKENNMPPEAHVDIDTIRTGDDVAAEEQHQQDERQLETRQKEEREKEKGQQQDEDEDAHGNSAVAARLIAANCDVDEHVLRLGREMRAPLMAREEQERETTVGGYCVESNASSSSSSSEEEGESERDSDSDVDTQAAVASIREKVRRLRATLLTSSSSSTATSSSYPSRSARSAGRGAQRRSTPLPSSESFASSSASSSSPAARLRAIMRGV